MEKYINIQIKKAGYYYIGHFNNGYIALEYEGGRISINPSKCSRMFELLYYVFGIDSEDGCFINDIEGKYCRLWVDEHRNIISIGHIVNDYFIGYSELGDE